MFWRRGRKIVGCCGIMSCYPGLLTTFVNGTCFHPVMYARWTSRKATCWRFICTRQERCPTLRFSSEINFSSTWTRLEAFIRHRRSRGPSSWWRRARFPVSCRRRLIVACLPCRVQHRLLRLWSTPLSMASRYDASRSNRRQSWLTLSSLAMRRSRGRSA